MEIIQMSQKNKIVKRKKLCGKKIFKKGLRSGCYLSSQVSKNQGEAGSN